MFRFLRLSAFTLALGYVTVSMVVLGFFAAPLWYALSDIVEDRGTHILQEDIQRLANLAQKQGTATLMAAVESREEGQQEGDEKYILLADASFAPIAGNLAFWPHEVPKTPGTHSVTLRLNHKSIHAIFVNLTLSNGEQLLLGRNRAKYRTAERLFLIGLAAAAAAVLLLGAIGGLLIRRALLSEVNDISLTASAIVGGNLSHRLPVRGGADELNILALTVNRMLDQIEHLVDGVRNVSNAIAHDLRTPLAELRTRLEELSLMRPDPETTFTEIDSAIADVDRVIGIFNALLRLAEIDAGTRRSGFIEVDVAAIAAEAVEFYQPLAEQQNIAISFSARGAIMLAGDPLLLAQAIGNLIDNALKYTQEGGTIAIEALQGTDGTAEVAVSDDGPGIPDAEKVRVLDRFYRGDASRGTPGAGLGLSLVAAVARLHGGVLQLRDHHPGLRAALRFPVAANRSMQLAREDGHASLFGS